MLAQNLGGHVKDPVNVPGKTEPLGVCRMAMREKGESLKKKAKRRRILPQHGFSFLDGQFTCLPGISDEYKGQLTSSH